MGSATPPPVTGRADSSRHQRTVFRSVSLPFRIWTTNRAMMPRRQEDHDGRGPTRRGNTRPHLPNLLRRLADSLGESAALRLARSFGGRRIYVPATPDPKHSLAKILGHNLFQWLTLSHGGDHVDVPLGSLASHHKQADLIRDLLANGLGLAEVAARAGCSTRTVRRHRRRLSPPAGLQRRDS